MYSYPESILLLVILFVITSTAQQQSDILHHQKQAFIQENLDAFALEQTLLGLSTDLKSNLGTFHFDVKFQGEPQKATVHTLEPRDIDVIGALGDSITAGTGANATILLGLGVQNRGLSWLIGGDQSLETSITLTTGYPFSAVSSLIAMLASFGLSSGICDILRKFNPEIKGYSVGNDYGKRGREENWYNEAVPGARAADLVGQARRLVLAMKNDNRTNFENDWKLVSIFIGFNDICRVHLDPNGTLPEAYVGEIQKAITILYQQLPRTIVQIALMMEMYVLPQVARADNAYPLCNLTQRLFCPYVAIANETELREINRQYQTQLEDLIGSGIFDTRDDFTVVTQPFFKNTVLPLNEEGKVDASYFSPDCFHFSHKSHALGALNIWNNMMEPVGEKTTTWGISDLKCPSQMHPFVFTQSNSVIARQSFEELPETATICKPENCDEIPSWSITVIVALMAVAATQTVTLLFVLRFSWWH